MNAPGECGTVIATTPIDGLFWESNSVSVAADGAFAIVSDSPGPHVADLVTHEPNFTYHHYGIHVGQIDRLTFFGDERRTIRGDFIDCRRGSPTTRLRHTMLFAPSHAKKLVIACGIAHTFSDIEHVVTRDEPIWRLTDHNPAYNLGNDVLNFPIGAGDDDIPLVTPNQLPIPDFCYRFVLDHQHAAYREQTPIYGMRYRVTLDGEERFVIVKLRKHQNERPQNRILTDDAGVFWSASYFASSGSSSYYLVESYAVASRRFLSPTSGTGTASDWMPLRDDAFLTFIGDPAVQVTVEVAHQGTTRPRFSETFSPDPLRGLCVAGGQSIRMRTDGYVLCRQESLEPGARESYINVNTFGRDAAA
jgi:hypothetical protein